MTAIANIWYKTRGMKKGRRGAVVSETILNSIRSRMYWYRVLPYPV
jgi:hypothetical protein